MKTANRVKSLGISMLLVAAMGLTHSATASAQSGSRATAPRRVQPAQTPQAHGSQTRARDGSGSNQRNVAAAKLGLEGYCPVCVVVGKGWVKGDPQFQSQYDGVNYLFPSADVKQMFDAEPARFTPALGGDCVVCLQDLRKRIPGSLQFSSLYNDRLFLFPDANVKAKFDAAPDSYADADLAGGGQCRRLRRRHEPASGGQARIHAGSSGIAIPVPRCREDENVRSQPGALSASIDQATRPRTGKGERASWWMPLAIFCLDTTGTRDTK